MSKFLPIYFVIFSGLVIGCLRRPSSTEFSDWTRPAPHSSDQTGFLIERVSLKDMLALEEELPNTAIRTLSFSRGIFEVVGPTAAEIKALLPRAELHLNHFFSDLALTSISPSEIPTSTSEIPISTLSETPTSAPSEVQAPPPSQVQNTGPNPHCTSFENPSENSLGLTIHEKEVGNLNSSRFLFPRSKTDLEFTLKKNEAGPPLDDFTLYWIVDGPDFFSLNRTLISTKIFKFAPLLMGSHTLDVIAQDSSYRCYHASAKFAVSAQEPLLPLLPNQSKRTLAQAGFTDADFTFLKRIGAPQIWSSSRGAGVKIAVLDSGVSYNHPDLRPNILTENAKLVGWDFVHGNDQPSDDLGHGTAVAGLAAGVLSGVAPEAQIMPIKVLNAFGDGDAGSIQAGIFWAIDHGADIIVASFGETNIELQRAIAPALKEAEAKGILIVAAAGNHSSDLERFPQYPACSGNANILTVAALTANGELAPYSNFGSKCVEIAAEGGEPKPPSPQSGSKNEEASRLGHLGGLMVPSSSFPERGLYARKFGTSMSAPIVAGAAALLKAADKSKSAVNLKAELLGLARQNSSLEGKVKLNAELHLIAPSQ